ncbi:MAG: TonB-dependent receptor [Desulfobacteraceae bacterium]|nr:TonB-dependent receptor [Desulfobacteraceae bacterium]
MKRLCWLFGLVLFLQAGLFVVLVAAQEEKTGEMEGMFDDGKTEEDYYRQDQVLLTATKNIMEVRKAPAISTVITAREIRNMGAKNISDVLRNIPGLQVFEGPACEGITQWGVRGIRTVYSEKVLLLIDGHKVNESFAGQFVYVFHDLTVENIKRIEVIRGPGSALYGTSAFVAVINVITKTAEDVGGQQFSVTAGEFNTQHYNLLFGHKDNNFRVSGHMDYFDTDGANSVIESDRLSSDTRFSSAAPGPSSEFAEKFDFGLRMTYGDLGLRLRFVDREHGTNVGAGSTLNVENTQSRHEYTYILGDIVYTKNFTDDLDMTVRLYADHFSFFQLLEIRPPGFTGGDDKGVWGNPQLKTKNTGAEITTNYVLGDHLITGGVHYENSQVYGINDSNNFGRILEYPSPISEDELFLIPGDRSIWAGYLQNMWEISSYDSLTLGVRYDYYDDFGGTVNPRLGYVHEFSNEMIMKVLYGSAFRAPTFNEVYAANNPLLLGNPDLEPEKIRTYEFGLEYPLMKYLTLKLNYFHNEIEDLITRGPIVEGEGKFINSTGKTKADGGEAELAFHFSRDKYGFINCSYQDGEDNNGNTLVDVSHWTANAGLNYGLWDYLNFNADVSWIGDRIRSEADGRDDVDSAMVVNLTLIAKNFFKTLEIRGSVYNVFDEDYRDPSRTNFIPNDLPVNERMFLVETRYTF